MASLEEAKRQQALARAKLVQERAREEAGVQGFWEKAYRFVTGEGRTEGYPELGTSGPSVPAIRMGEGPELHRSIAEKYGLPYTGAPELTTEGKKMMGAYATQVDPKSIADIAVKTLSGIDPDVKQGADKYGNPTVTFEGQTYYVNAPGFSQADAFQLLAQIGAFAPAARIGAAARGIFGRMLRTGILSAGTSVGLDVVGQELGSEQPVDWMRAGATGAIGAAMEGLVPVAVSGWRQIFGNRKFFDPATGRLTEAGRQQAMEAGLDPMDMDRRLAEAFGRQVMDEPVPALAKTRAYEEAYGIPYTRGQQLAQAGDFEQIAREEGMRHGTRGAEAKSAMLATDELYRARTQEAIDKAIGRTARKAQETGEDVLTGVQAAQAAKKSRVDELYDIARPVAEAAKVERGRFIGLYREVTDTLEEFDLDPMLFPATNKILRNIKGLSARKRGMTAPTLRKLETERRKIGSLINSATTKADKSAAIEAKAAFDKWLEREIDDILMSGDPTALASLKAARKEASEYFSLFTKQRGGRVNDEIGGVVEKLLYAEATPEQAMNYVLGAGQLGKKQTATGVVKRLKGILGEGSDGWEALKDAGWWKLTRDNQGQMKSPKMFVKAFDELYAGNKSLMDEMYTPTEIKTMKTVRDAIDMMKIPEHVRNPSGTAWTLLSFARRMFAWRGQAQAVLHRRPLYGGMLRFIGSQLPVAGPVMQGTAARQAATQIPRPLPTSPRGVAAGVAGGRTANE